MNPTPFHRGEDPRAEARWVYFIEASGTGLIKIGVANCAKTRMAQLEKASPVALRLLGVQETDKAGSLEKDLHRRFAEHREHGEWFRSAPELVVYIAANAVEYRRPRRPTHSPVPKWLSAA